MYGCEVKFDERTKLFTATLHGFLIAAARKRETLPGKVRAAFRGPLSRSVKVIRPYYKGIEEGIATVPYGALATGRLDVQWPGRKEREYLCRLIADTPENRELLAQAKGFDADADFLRSRASDLRRQCTKAQPFTDIFEAIQEAS